MKTTLLKLAVCVFGITVSIATSILVLMFGWGLEPKNYTVIILLALFGDLFAQVLIGLAASKD